MKKRSRKNRVPKVKGTPNPIVQSLADKGKQRLVEQFRNTDERERQNGYGGDQIEDAALYAGRMVSRGAETFIRTRMAELMTVRRESAEPPLYDPPFDLTVSPEPSAQLELSAPETPVETAEKPAGRHLHPEPEIFPSEKKEDSWTPAYRDRQSDRRYSPASEKYTERTPDMSVRESGEVPKVRSREVSPVQKTDHSVKVLPNSDAVSTNTEARIHSTSASHLQEQNTTGMPEQGKQNFIRERSQQTAVRQANISPADPGISEAPGGTSAEASVPNPPQTDFVTVRSTEMPSGHLSPVKTGTSPQIAARGNETIIRERTEKITVKPAAAGRESGLQIKTASPLIGSKKSPEEIPLPDKSVSVRTSARMETPTPLKVPERDLLIQLQSEAAPVKPVKKAEVPKQELTPVKGKETFTQNQTPADGKTFSVNAGRKHAIRERTSDIGVKRTNDGDSVRTDSPQFENRTLPNAPRQERMPVKTKETFTETQTPSGMKKAFQIIETVKNGEIRGRVESGQTSVKTKDAYIRSQTSAAEPVTAQTDNTVSKDAPKEIQKNIRTREGLIQSPEPSVETSASPQIETVLSETETAVSSGMDQRMPDSKTGSACAQKEAVPSREQSNQTVEQGRQKFIWEQKRKADLKRADADKRRPKIRGTQLVKDTETTPDRVKQPRNIRAKETRILPHGAKHPEKGTVLELPDGKFPVQQTVKNTPLKLANELSGGKEIPRYPTKAEIPDGGIKIRTPSKKFIREKGKTAGNIVEKTARNATSGGRKAIKTMRPVVVKETGKVTGKSIKTAESVSKKAVKTARTASAQMVQNAKRTAQTAAKVKAVKEIPVRAMKHGAKTLQDAAQAVITTAKAAAASMQSLIAALSAGGGIVMVIIIVICLTGLLIAAPWTT